MAGKSIFIYIREENEVHAECDPERPGKNPCAEAVKDLYTNQFLPTSN